MNALLSTFKCRPSSNPSSLLDRHVSWAVGLLLLAMLPASAAHAQVGKCCLPDGRGCRDVTQSQCDSFGGVFVPGQLCANPDDTCDAPVSGACCFAAGCQVVLASACPGGTLFQPNGTCPSTTCNPPQFGACCRGLDCEVTSNILCSDGVFTPDVVCTTNFCGVPPTGACCANAQCLVLTRDECFQFDGAEWYPDTPCSDTFCALGACCVGPTSCVITTMPGCEVGFWFADGTCAPGFCIESRGSCCRDNGTCVLTVEGDCPNGSWQIDTTCAGRVCTPALGACCTGAAGCVMTTQAQCNGTFNSAGACTPVNVCCPADATADGTLDVVDLFFFLDDWFTNSGMSGPNFLSDFNRDQFVDVVDLFGFLDAWFAGCA